MPTLSLTAVTGDGEHGIRVPVDRLVNCGWTGRDAAAVRAHVAELEAEGVTAPEETPAVYPKPRHLVTTGDGIEVASRRTSGEAEFVLLPTDDGVYVGVGSDHTDRDLEAADVELSKLVCPNVLGDRVWRLADAEDHWDRIALRSWTDRDGERIEYQAGTLGELRPPSDLLAFVRDRLTAPLAGTVVFSGSIGTLGGELVCGRGFEAELADPVLDRRLAVSYRVDPIDWLD